jgi:thiosulfate/3-mercaptopyruvate sulfurtransferase
LAVLDGSWYLSTAARDPGKEFLAGHIPGARFFDLDRASDPETPLPHMLPGAAQFTRQMRALGIRRDQAIVVYDGSGANLSAARVWWMFRVFGHRAVAVLDGGFGKWLHESRPVETGTPAPASPSDFEARLNPALVRDLASVRANLTSGKELVVDMRPAGRFAGTDPEPRPGIRSGHIPGSVSLPYTELVTADGALLTPDRLRARLAASGLALDRPIVATCGSATSACALILALETLGFHRHAVYDGAWTEWGGTGDTPVETG